MNECTRCHHSLIFVLLCSSYKSLSKCKQVLQSPHISVAQEMKNLYRLLRLLNARGSGEIRMRVNIKNIMFRSFFFTILLQMRVVFVQ